MCLSILVSLGYMRSGRIAGLYDSFISRFLRNLHTVFHTGYIHLPTMQGGSLFSTASLALVCGFFDDGHSDWCEVIFHCSFDLLFS